MELGASKYAKNTFLKPAKIFHYRQAHSENFPIFMALWVFFTNTRSCVYCLQELSLGRLSKLKVLSWSPLRSSIETGRADSKRAVPCQFITCRRVPSQNVPIQNVPCRAESKRAHSKRAVPCRGERALRAVPCRRHPERIASMSSTFFKLEPQQLQKSRKNSRDVFNLVLSMCGILYFWWAPWSHMWSTSEVNLAWEPCVREARVKLSLWRLHRAWPWVWMRNREI